MRLIIASSAAVLSLAACATEGPGRYQAEYDQLAADCRARGGVLIPTGGEPTGHPQTEYACRLQDVTAGTR